jgi:sulfatase modifying factor 1
VTNIAPVGTATEGAGRWGQLDLAGEVSEWNLDSLASYVDPCTDCAYLTEPSSRVLRGGSFYVPTSYLLPPFRGAYAPDTRDGTLGFRCARAP